MLLLSDQFNLGKVVPSKSPPDAVLPKVPAMTVTPSLLLSQGTVHPAPCHHLLRGNLQEKIASSSDGEGGHRASFFCIFVKLHAPGGDLRGPLPVHGPDTSQSTDQFSHSDKKRKQSLSSTPFQDRLACGQHRPQNQWDPVQNENGVSLFNHDQEAKMVTEH